MGLLDWPAPLLSWLDDLFSSTAPESVRLVFWGIIAAGLSMSLYWLLSPQQRLARIAAEERALKDRLQDETVELAEGMTSIGQLLRLALWRLALVVSPAAIAVLPVLCLMTWLQVRYAYALPEPHRPVPVRVEPGYAHGTLTPAAANAPPRVDVRNAQGRLLQTVPLSAPVPVLHKWMWWNVLIGNPSGYLPDDAPIERIEIGLPEKHYLSIGPDWARRWETMFLGTLLMGSLLLKVLFRIR